MRVLLTGGTGTIGSQIQRDWSDDEVVAPSRQELDVTAEAQVVAAVVDLMPDVVVHAAAWTDVDGCERDPDRAHRVNALGAWWVARACALAGATMVLLSTDHVVGGAQPGARSEFDPPTPVNAYARSKHAAETLVRATVPAHHIVRTAWLAGVDGDSFVRTILRRARAGQPLQVIDDQHGSPTFASDLAPALREVAVSGRHGTWHRTNAGEATRHELAVATVAAAGLDVPVQAISSSALERPAPRPAHAVLDDLHAVAAGLSRLPHWRDALVRLVAELGDQP